MVDLLRTRSGIISVITILCTHWDKIVEFEQKFSSIPADNIDQRYDLYLKLRMNSINAYCFQIGQTDAQISFHCQI